MIQMKIAETLQANYVLLHQIHLFLHVNCKQSYKRQKNQYRQNQNDRWSQEEDNIMNTAIQIYRENVKAISQVVASKSRSQVYQRLRYLRDEMKRIQTGKYYENSKY
ncbi:Homeobox-like_domain superfamily [Hexamita inflata]|uniref:Homeobox-like domain superfamily n=1 Tax=Hexamita inflata TaxID=28002 RepID=A0AA86R4G1_9EUKA|nr:Homeobox-like domain superfamily [Hexamita inflata]